MASNIGEPAAGASAGVSGERIRRAFFRFLLYLFLAVTGVVGIMPVLWAFFSSLKPSQEIILNSLRLLPHVWTLENYIRLPEAAPFGLFFLNSLILSTVSTIFIIFGCTALGFVFAKYRFKGRDFFFFLVIATILIPQQAYLVMQYMMVNLIGAVNTYVGLVFPFVVMSSGIFFMRQNILTIPDELLDFARIDGASEFGIFWYIVFPLSKSAMAAISIINWVFTWNRFIWPLVVSNSKRLYTMQLGLAYFQRQFDIEYGATLAASVICMLPVMIAFLIFRRQIIQGITMSGMKG